MNTEKRLKSGWRRLLKVVRGADDLDELFRILLTKKERFELSQRILIIDALLKKERTQREISRELQVSIAKITRGSNELKTIDAKLRKFLQGEL